jgi:3-deoxy-D-manno-octulosonic-acid transferase
MGAPGNRIEVNGNAKYDLLLKQVDGTDREKMKRLYKLRGDSSVFMAGSIRGAEERIIIDVYEKIVQAHPEVILMIAPRHVERSRHIEEMVRERGFSYQFRTDLDKESRPRTASVVIIDMIGELQSTYSIASIVFCGGSLVPLGGQNILEAAVWGKPVFYGPSMEDFLDAKDLLDKTGGGIQVRDGRELAEKALYFFDHPEEAEMIGRLAKKAVVLNQGSARKHAMVIQRLLT